MKLKTITATEARTLLFDEGAEVICIDTQGSRGDLNNVNMVKLSQHKLKDILHHLNGADNTFLAKDTSGGE